MSKESRIKEHFPKRNIQRSFKPHPPQNGQNIPSGNAVKSIPFTMEDGLKVYRSHYNKKQRMKRFPAFPDIFN